MLRSISMQLVAHTCIWSLIVADWPRHPHPLPPPHQNRVRAEGGIPPLVALLDAWDIKVQRAGAGALRTLAFKNEENKRQIVEGGALPRLIQARGEAGGAPPCGRSGAPSRQFLAQYRRSDLLLQQQSAGRGAGAEFPGRPRIPSPPNYLLTPPTHTHTVHPAARCCAPRTWACTTSRSASSATSCTLATT